MPGSSRTVIARSSGGGRRSVTSTGRPAASGTRSASEPETKPPLPERAGPLKRAGTTQVGGHCLIFS